MWDYLKKPFRPSMSLTIDSVHQNGNNCWSFQEDEVSAVERLELTSETPAASISLGTMSMTHFGRSFRCAWCGKTSSESSDLCMPIDAFRGAVNIGKRHWAAANGGQHETCHQKASQIPDASTCAYFASESGSISAYAP